MGETIHAMLSLLIALAAVLLKTRRRVYWMIVWLLVGVSVIAPLFFADSRSVPLLFGHNRPLSLVAQSAVMFGLPIVAAARVGDSVISWNRQYLAFVVIPAAYFGTLFLAIVLGTGAGVLVP
jgi:hypothetical protein